ncbi:hypothetical protein M1446_00870 [Candidatus Dependentiae bacterium]|nr:hypothetical protein [Candidatus Dependentiae bacterium]
MKKRLLNLILILLIFSITNSSNISFISSMHKSSSFDKNYASKNKDWILLKKLYEKNFLNKIHNINDKSEYKIPPIIHHIWIGPNPLPKESEILIESWKKYHPDWAHKLWTNEDLKDFKLTNKKQFDSATNWGEKSDILRYEILYKYGGLYVDHDFECLKSFDNIHKCCSFYAGILHSKKVEIANGIIGSTPGHPLLKICIDNIKEKGSNNNVLSILARTGPYYFTKCFLNYVKNGSKDIIAFPVSFFFPMNNNEQNCSREMAKKWIQQESYAIHYWACSWCK